MPQPLSMPAVLSPETDATDRGQWSPGEELIGDWGEPFTHSQPIETWKPEGEAVLSVHVYLSYVAAPPPPACLHGSAPSLWAGLATDFGEVEAGTLGP